MGEKIELVLEFKEDGTITGVAMGEKAEGQWAAKEDGQYDVTIEGETEELTLAEGKLNLEIAGAKAVFEKK